MAFKAMILLTRREGMTGEEFAQWWLEQHAPLAKQLPGVRDARFNLITRNGDDDFTGPDGISELWFDNQEAFEAAYAADIGVAVAADSQTHVSARQRLFVTEHCILDAAEHEILYANDSTH